MVVRLPATLVALGLGLALNAATLTLASHEPFGLWPFALLPIWAGVGGFVATRWGLRTPPAPGFAVGLLLVACQVGATFGPYPDLVPFLDPRLLLLQIIAAMSGGLTGAVLLRRSGQAAQPKPGYTSLV